MGGDRVRVALAVPREIRARQGPCPISVGVVNPGPEAVQVDLGDGVALRWRSGEGAWQAWSRGRNGTRPGPHTVRLAPGEAATADLGGRLRASGGRVTLLGEDRTGALWWIGPLSVGDRVTLAATLSMPAGEIVGGPETFWIVP